MDLQQHREEPTFGMANSGHATAAHVLTCARDVRRAMRRLAPALLLAVEATVFFSEDFSGDCAPLPRRRYPRRAALTAALAAPQGSRAGW